MIWHLTGQADQKLVGKAGHMTYAGLHGRLIGFVHGLLLQTAQAVLMSVLELLDTGLPDITSGLQRPPTHRRNSTCQGPKLP